MNTNQSDIPVSLARSGGWWLPSWGLWRREMVRFFRQRNRVIGALVTPVVIWLLLGSGFNRSFVASGESATVASGIDYLEYFYAGMVVLSLLFTAIFSTISVIEDRREGFMQGVLVAPIPRLGIVIGKVLGGASIATIQGVIFLAFWPVIGRWPGGGAMLAAVGVMFFIALGMTALSLCFAWQMDSTAGFHVVMNLFLMPMWCLSGGMFPIKGASFVTQLIMRVNPLTYGHAAFQTLISGGRIDTGAGVSLGVALAIWGGFTAGMILLAGWVVARPRKDGAV